MGVYRKCTKRVLDVAVSTAALIILSPLMVVIGLLVARDLGRPVIFRQRRVGLNEQTFEVLKFRSMVDARDDHGKLLPDSERVTRLGQYIRHTSLDELPQLVNVLRGDMSIVGPRPLPVHYLPYYRPYERTRHTVTPGITGLAQVEGRTSLTWDEKLGLDVEYVKKFSFLLDCRIALKTVKRVLGRSDIRDTAIEGPLSACRAQEAAIARRESDDQVDNAAIGTA